MVFWALAQKPPTPPAYPLLLPVACGHPPNSYKALNTFIDDLFAFIIKMPTMHRLACFRDDVIFFIYL